MSALQTKKITNFFKPLDATKTQDKADTPSSPKDLVSSKISSKRKLDENDPDMAETVAKVRKVAEEQAVLSPTIGLSWFKALEAEFVKPYFAALSSFAAKERSTATVFPSFDEVWAWTTKTNIRDTRVVILGQDPYPTPGNAHGLCFSVKVGVPHPASLKNIFKEVEDDIPGFKRPSHGFLGGWADQGVLLLNSVLTVRSGEANSHKGKGWEQLTDAVIKWISDNCRGVVFMLWGGYAKKKAAKVDAKKHHILNATHPSPLGANKGGWFGCKHFSTCNKLLVESGREAIDWNHLPDC